MSWTTPHRRDRDPYRFAAWLGGLALALAMLGTAPAAATVTPPEPTLRLPSARSLRVAADSRWIVGARASEVADRIARRHGARLLRLPGAYVVDAREARALAGALRARGLLKFAEPDVRRHAMSSFDATPGLWARGAIVAPGLVPPPATVPFGIVDEGVDASHPDLAGHVTFTNGSQISGPHGTEVASTATGSANGSGVTGIFPGAPVVSYAVPEPFTCADSADGILELASRRVPVINASYGSMSPCYVEYSAVSIAYAVGSLVVASAGNEFQEGNPVEYPAGYPHVLSVAAVDANRQSSYFSSEAAAVDVSAPGEQVPVAVPVALDDDGVADGTTLADGTSFSSPIVAAAATWIRAARPGASNGQIADLLRRTSDDIAPAGWDQATGYGQINLARALATPLPRIDPLEPNDTIGMVDGTVFREHDPSVWKGTGRFSFNATVDTVEDPVDVFRLRIPRRASFNVLVHPAYGDPDLAIYRRAARSLSQTRYVVAQSERGEGRTDAVRLVNNSGATITVYVVVYVPDSARFADSAYRLEFQRKRRR